ncbi:MAG: BrnT family toxin [Nitrospirae bacterium]|nr:BrnT family toxin [Nitrospirota bacterium]
MVSFAGVEGFDWDSGNKDKNWSKHEVHWFECEEVFFHRPLVGKHDTIHSERESRYAVLGRTAGNRGLAVVFTIRAKRIRIISARDMNRKERNIYEEQIKRDTGF